MQPDLKDSLVQFDTCVLADALDHIGIQMHVRASDPPMTGHRKTGHMYFRHTAWWQEISRMQSPRFIVIEDIDRRVGSGSCMGKIGAAVFSALDCVGAITNGAVREIEDVSSTGFGLFAGHLSPARAYAHLVDHSSTVVISGLTINPGDLLAADRHGVFDSFGSIFRDC